MPRSRRHQRIAVVACVLLLAGVAPLVLSAASASAMSCPPAVIASAEHRDGGWWLYDSNPGCGGAVVRYDHGWNPTGERVGSSEIAEAIGRETYSEIVDLQATDDGWLVFHRDGHVSRLNRSFGDAEPVRVLPAGVFSGARGPHGNWWVGTGEGVRVVAADGNRTLRRIDGRWSVSAVGDDVYLVGDRPFGGVVRRYDVLDTWSGESPPPTERVTIGPAVRNPATVTAGPTGRMWVVSSHGHRFAYRDWRLVGASYEDPLYAVLLGGALFLLPAVLAVVVGLGLSAVPREEPAEWVLVGIAAVPASVLIRQALVPFPLTVLYWLPDPAAATVLTAPTAATFVALHRRSHLDVLAVLRYAMLTAPMLLLAFDFLRAP